MKMFGVYQHLVFKKATTQEVVTLLDIGEISLNTEIFSFSSQQWNYAGEYFSGHMSEICNYIVMPRETANFSLLTKLNKKPEIKGPFEMKDIIFLIQSHKLGPYDLIFNPAAKQWVFANTLFADFFASIQSELPEETDSTVDFDGSSSDTLLFSAHHFWKQDSSIPFFDLHSILDESVDVVEEAFVELEPDTPKVDILDEIGKISNQIEPLKKGLKKIHQNHSKDNRELIKQNELLVKEIQILKEDNKRIIDIIEAMKNQIEENHDERKKDLIKNTKEIDSFKNSVSLIQQSIIQKEKEVKEKQKAKQLLESQSAKNSEDEHLWFSISNEKEWIICESEEKISRSYSFDEVHRLFHNGKLNNTNLKIKQIGKKLWKPLHSNDYLSLDLRVREDVAGKKLIELKRKSSRIPFEGKSTIATKEGQVIGNCVDIATGGCFIDISKKECNEFFKGQRISFQIDSKLAEGIFNLEGEIIKINTGRESGLQIKFLNKSEKFSADIDQIIKKYFFYLNRKAA